MQAWDAFLRFLDEKFGKDVVDKWLRSLQIIHFDACNLYLESQSSFQVAWFEEHVRAIAKNQFINNNGHIIKIHLSANSKKKKNTPTHYPIEPIQIESDGIDASQTFAHFLYEKKNAWTIELLKNIKPGAYNPIFLYGPHGIGKTHLLMATAQTLQKKGLQVFYVHAETFTQHVVKAMRMSHMRQFREIYRNQDILIIDDVQVFARRNSTQEEFFHTFNALHTMGKQIILSSNALPTELEDIEPRLISRFEWGIILELFPLSTNKLLEVLKIKAHAHQFPISEEILDFLQKNFSTSTKVLMRSLDALMLRYKGSSSISLDQARFLLNDLLQIEKKVQPSWDKIVEFVSSYFGICSSDILGKSQVKEYTFPRKLAMFLCREKLGLSYPAIGRLFQRNHSTVMSSVRLIEKNKTSQEIKALLQEIEMQFKS